MIPATELGALEPRLERLTGEESSCCVTEYRALAEKVSRSERFPATLRRIKALADEKRLLAVFLLRRRGELCACEIQAAVQLGHATVSHHMGILISAGIVRSRREGKWTYYRLTQAGGRILP